MTWTTQGWRTARCIGIVHLLLGAPDCLRTPGATDSDSGGEIAGTLAARTLVVGLVALVAWAVSRATTHDHETRAPERSEALEVLRGRFARGEITEAEYKLAANVLRTDR
jgi:hypothetical protein